jgi:phage tail-like protein
MDPTADSAVAVYFKFEIDGIDLGTFKSVSGLGVNFSVTSKKEGGGGIFMHHLPGRFEYDPLVVRRPVGPYTKNTMLWLAKMTSFHSSTTARLAALDANGKTIFSWVFMGVTPKSWKGPSFDVENPKVAEEELTLLYTAFMIDIQEMGVSSTEYAATLAAGYTASGQTAIQSVGQAAIGAAEKL